MTPARIVLPMALLAAVAGPVAAADAAGQYPVRPIRLVLPFPPGGGTDAVARVLTPKLSAAMGQQWVVDNRGGAAGNIAGELVARATPDGYTLLMGFSTALTANRSLYKDTKVDAARELAPIIQLATSQYILSLHPSVAAGSVAELVALAKAKPGTLNFASAGIGSPLHLSGELFKSRAGINIVHVAYKGGGPAAVATMAGEAQMVFGSVAASLAQIKAGKLKALAVTGLKRSVLAPSLPTMHESGFPGFNVTAWNSFLAPAGTPGAVIRRIHADSVKLMRDPEVIKLMNNSGYEVTATTPEELGNIIRTETDMWTKIIKDAGIVPQ